MSLSISLRITINRNLFINRFVNYAAAIICVICFFSHAHAQQHRRAVNIAGQRAVVVDERLAALRESPDVSGRLVHRLNRGRAIGILGARRVPNGLLFYRVAVTLRTRGWLQSDSVVAPARAGEDERLWRLVQGSEGFDQLARARIFLDLFPRSNLRPAVLMLYGDTAEEAATKLSRDATRRLTEREMTAGGAPVFSYYMNFNELDRYNKQGVAFAFDSTARAFHYDGASWREIVRRYPRSIEAAQARTRLGSRQATAGR